MKKHSFYIQGTHCNSCKFLIEETLIEYDEISSVQVHLQKEIIEIEGNFSISREEIVHALNPLLKPHQYSLSLEKERQRKDFSSLYAAIPIGGIVLTLFFLLQTSEIINFGFEGGLTPWTAFIIGIIASVSSCLAVVGGLTLSLSAQISQKTSTFRPFAFFHIGRLLSFMIFGGILGMIGGTLAINSTITTVLGLIAAIVMIILGINLLDVFQWTKYWQLTMPKKLLTVILKMEHGFWAPYAIGTMTFFLPCGFTQSMQIAALSSGTWLTGTMITTMFALGTLPMLVLVSFSSFRFAHTKYAPVFFRAAGIIVIGLGIFSFLTGLAGLGIIQPLLSI